MRIIQNFNRVSWNTIVLTNYIAKLHTTYANEQFCVVSNFSQDSLVLLIQLHPFLNSSVLSSVKNQRTNNFKMDNSTKFLLTNFELLKHFSLPDLLKGKYYCVLCR